MESMMLLWQFQRTFWIQSVYIRNDMKIRKEPSFLFSPDIKRKMLIPFNGSEVTAGLRTFGNSISLQLDTISPLI